MRKLLAPLLALVMLPLVSTCGGDDGGASCGTFTPCGGSPVGSWNISQFCLGGGAGFDDECPAATLNASGLKAMGSITYNADMTYSSTMTLSGSAVMTLPASCLDGLTCAQAQAFLTIATADPESPFSAASCTGSSDCTCTLTFRPTPSAESGRWAVNGNTITQTETGSNEGEPNEFCVAGNSMRLRTPMSMMMMGEGSAQIVLTKK